MPRLRRIHTYTSVTTIRCGLHSPMISSIAILTFQILGLICLSHWRVTRWFQIHSVASLTPRVYIQDKTSLLAVWFVPRHFRYLAEKSIDLTPLQLPAAFCASYYVLTSRRDRQDQSQSRCCKHIHLILLKTNHMTIVSFKLRSILHTHSSYVQPTYYL